MTSMNRFRAFCAVCVFLAGSTTWSVSAAELYVSPKGDDANPGTREKPLAGLEKAKEKVRSLPKDAPRIVHLDEGVYTLDGPVTFSPEDSGTAASPILYRGVGGKTVLSGGKALTGWKATEADEDLWVADIPKTEGRYDYFEQLFVDDHRAVRARFPNRGFLIPRSVHQDSPMTAEGMRVRNTAQTLTARDGELAEAFRGVSPEELKFAQLVVHHHWDTTRRIVLKYDAQSETIHTRGAPMKHWNPWRNTSQYYLENLRTAFDEPGEWFYDGLAGKVYYRPLPGETLAGTSFHYAKPGLNRLLVFRGNSGGENTENGEEPVSHLRWENIRFVYADTPRNPEVMKRADLPQEVAGAPEQSGPSQFEPEQAAFYTGAAITLDGCRDVSFTDCRFSHLGEYAIHLQNSDRCVMQRCVLNDLGAGGIRIGHRSSGNVVDNCLLRGAGRFHASAVGIWIGNHCNDNRITHNDISDLYYTGISVGWTWGYNGTSFRNTVEFNRIHKIGQGAMADMGGVYTLGTAHGTQVCHNVIFDVTSYAYGGWGLYPDEGSEGILMENNLVYDTTDGSFHQHYGKNNTIRNNIFAFSRPHQIAVTRVEPHRSLTFENNIVLWSEGNAIGYNSEKARVDWGSNLWWNTAGAEKVDFKGKPHADWVAFGKDVGGQVVDPLFEDVENRDFRLKNDSPAPNMGFVPFDFTQAGLYGDSAWTNLAPTQ